MALREVFASFSVAFDRRSLDAGTAGVGNAIAGLRQLGTVVAGLAVVEGMRRAATATVDFVVHQEHLAGAIDDTARMLNTSTDGLQRWRFASQIATGSAENADSAMAGLQRVLAQSVNGSSAASDGFRRLGVSLRGPNGELRRTDEVFTDTVRALSRIQNPTARAAAAFSTLGRRSMSILPLLARGEEGIADLSAQFDELGGGLDEDTIATLGEFGDEMDRLDLATQGFKGLLASFLAPALTTVTGALTSAAAAFGFLERNTQLVQASLYVLAGVMALVAIVSAPVWIPVLLGAALVVAAIIAVIIVVEDLIVAFEGGASVSARFWTNIVRGIESTVNAVRELLGLGSVSLTGGLQRSQNDKEEKREGVALRRQRPIRGESAGGLLDRAAFGSVTSSTQAFGSARTLDQSFGPPRPRARDAARGGVVLNRPTQVNVEVRNGANEREVRRAIEQAMDRSDSELVDVLRNASGAT